MTQQGMYLEQPQYVNQIRLDTTIPKEPLNYRAIPRNSVLDAADEYEGIQRKYPRKTFDDGDLNPPEVLHELHEISNYIGYSVFSKNQLRFVEKMLKTSTYIENENYIRSPNMFISLNKPKFWNMNNYLVLERSIGYVLDIEKEMLKSIPENYTNSIVDTAVAFCDNMKSWIYSNKLSNKKFTDGIRNLVNYTEFAKTLKINPTYEDYIANGLFCATYNKIVSAISYLNPYVQAKKDTGVNTMTPPVTSMDNIVKSERNYNNTYTDLLTETTGISNNFIETTKKGRDLIAKQSVSNTKNNMSKTTTYTANSYYKLVAFPLYSLNILLPIKLMPTIFVLTNNYPAIGEVLLKAKLAGSILKIPISSILSKLVTLNSNQKRITLNLITKKDNQGNVTSTVKATTGDSYNLSYYKKVMGVRQYHYLEGTQNGNTTSINAKMLEAIPADQTTLQQAISLIPQMKKDEKFLGRYATIGGNVSSGPTQRYKERTRDLKANLMANNAYIDDSDSFNTKYMVSTIDDGPQIVTEDQLRPLSKSIIKFTDAKGNVVFVYNPSYHNFGL